MEGLMGYTFGDMIPISNPGITYGVMEFSNMIVREVYENGSQAFKYHIAIRGVKRPSQDFIDIISNTLRCESGPIDADYTMDLDYSLYAIVEDELVRDIVVEMLTITDDKISELLDEKK